MVKSRKLGRPHPQLDDLFDVTAVYPFLTFDEAADLLKYAGRSHFYSWESTTPEEELRVWMKYEEMDNWPVPLDYTRENLLRRLKNWVGVFRKKAVFDPMVVAAGKAIFWTYLYALEDGEVLIEWTDSKGKRGGEWYWLLKTTEEFYAGEFSVLN